MAKQFDVIVQGQLRPGFDPEQVEQQLQSSLRLHPQQARQLLSGRARTVKKAVDRITAQTYSDRLSALGLLTHIQASAGTRATPWFSALDLRCSPAYRRALWRAGLQIAGLVVPYTALLLGIALVLLSYLWHFAYLLSAPPLFFSVTVYLCTALLMAIGLAALSRPLPPPAAAPAIQETAQNTDANVSEFIGQLTAALSLPAPASLRLDTGTTITAQLQAGARHFYSGHYELIVGLPMLQCLSARSCAGLLAAVLGPGSRPNALRLRGMIHRMKARLATCVANEDALGTGLRNARTNVLRQGAPFALRFLALANPGFARAAQRIGAIEWQLDEATRREAARWHAAVAGNRSLEATRAAVQRLDTARDAAERQQAEQAMALGPVDDLPTLIRHYFKHLDRDIGNDDFGDAVHAIDQAQADSSTHRPGIMSDEGDAAPLLEAASALGQELTRHRSGASRRPPVAAEIYCHHATEILQQRRRARRYFNGWFLAERFWRLPELALLRDLSLNDAAEQLNVCVNEIRRLTPDRQRLLADYTRLQNQVRELTLAQPVLAAGHDFSFRHGHCDNVTLRPLLESRQQQLTKIMEQLAVQESIMGGRIALGLRLSGRAPEDIEGMQHALSCLFALGPRLHRFRQDSWLLAQLHERRQRRERGYNDQIAHLETQIASAAQSIREKLGGVSFPVGHHGKNDRRFTTQILGQAVTPLQHAEALLEGTGTMHRKLALLVADCGTTAEEAYRIERIRLVTPG